MTNISALMNLAQCNTVIVFGGTFDPPHVAHVILPLLALEALGADAVAYVPVATAPHKTHEVHTPAFQRLAMLRLALQDLRQAVILTDELDRAGNDRPSYTVDTLEALRQRLDPRSKLRLLIGGDQLRIFPKWHQAQRIEELAQPAVLVRPPDTPKSLLAALSVGARKVWMPRLLDLPQMTVSATTIRRRVTAGLSVGGLVHPAVEDYIRRMRLYRPARA